MNVGGLFLPQFILETKRHAPLIPHDTPRLSLKKVCELEKIG